MSNLDKPIENLWITRQEAMALIDKVKGKRIPPAFKYISIKVDTRDGKCLLLDRYDTIMDNKSRKHLSDWVDSAKIWPESYENEIKEAKIKTGKRR